MVSFRITFKSGEQTAELDDFTNKSLFMQLCTTPIFQADFTQSCAQTKIKFARIPDQKKGATDETRLCVLPPNLK